MKTAKVMNLAKSGPQKLAFFLELALNGQQLGLVIYQDISESTQLEDMCAVRSDKIYHIDSLEKLKALKQGIALIELNKDNLVNFLEFGQRTLPTLNKHDIVLGLNDGVKTIFTLSKDVMLDQSEEIQEKILKTFLPIFKFNV